MNSDANFLFGDTDDLDEDELLDLDGEPTASTSNQHPCRVTPIGPIPKPLVLSATSVPVVRYRRVLKHVPNVPYVPLTGSNGDRLYLRLLPDGNNISLEVKVIDPRKVKITPKPYKSILGVDFHALRREAELMVVYTAIIRII